MRIRSESRSAGVYPQRDKEKVITSGVGRPLHKTDINTMTFQTEFQREKEQRDMKIYQEFITLTAEPGAAVSKVQEFLMKKYGIHSSSTLWAIRKRVEAKLRKK